MPHMKRCTSPLIIIGILILFSACRPQLIREDSIPEWQLKLNILLQDKKFQSAHIGIDVKEVETGKNIFSYQSDKLFVPASNVKLAIAGASLHYLKPDHRFQTHVLAHGNALELVGRGDPHLTISDLQSLAKRIKTQGIKSVSSVFGNDTYFKSSRLGDGWVWDDGSAYYAAPISALSVNDNAVSVRVDAASAARLPAQITLFPATGYIQLPPPPMTTESASESLTLDMQPTGDRDRLVIKGAIAPGAEPAEDDFCISHPTQFAATLFAEALRAEGVQVKAVGKLKPSSQSTWLATHTSPPLSEQMRPFLKESVNLKGEILLRDLGTENAHTPPTESATPKGLELVSHYLEREAGWLEGGYRIADGSGLSRYNLVTPGQLTGLLLALKRSPDGVFIEQSLPIGGVDGTLKNRFIGMKSEKRIRAKTGSLSGVSALSGYLTTDSGKTLAISILVNGFVGSSKPYRQLQEDIVEQVSTL